MPTNTHYPEPLWVDYDLEGEGYTVICDINPHLPLEHYQADVLGHPYSELDTHLVSYSGMPFSQEGFIEWITPKIITPSDYDELPF